MYYEYRFDRALASDRKARIKQDSFKIVSNASGTVKELNATNYRAAVLEAFEYFGWQLIQY